MTDPQQAILTHEYQVAVWVQRISDGAMRLLGRDPVPVPWIAPPAPDDLSELEKRYAYGDR